MTDYLKGKWACIYCDDEDCDEIVKNTAKPGLTASPVYSGWCYSCDEYEGVVPMDRQGRLFQ